MTRLAVWYNILSMDDRIRSQFEALEHYTYLNSAAVSPIPRAAVSAVVKQLNDVANHGSDHYTDWIATKNRARSLIAEMLHVRPEQIGFMRNTSDGFASIANGIDWKQGDNIVTFAREFPANFYPWRMVRDRYGVELRMCPERDGRVDLDEFIALIDGNTRLAAISAVQYDSGFRADLERIGRAVRSVDGLFAVDIIQGFGQMGYDLPSQYVDIAAGASHKWLCAPEGCGILYISDRARERLEPSFVGWISVETPWDFEDREQPYKPNALAWESGTGASSLFYGLEESLKLLNEAGLNAIEEYLASLTDQLCDMLAGRPYKLISSRTPEESSAIVCVQHTGGIHCSEIAEKLQKEQIIVSARGERLRIAPHFYNTAEDIEKLVAALP